MDSNHWQAQAACRTWVEVFDKTFDSSSRTSSSVHRTAVEVCQGCPVRKNCFTDAMRHEGRSDRFGMRAGLMPVERSRLARQRG